MNTSILFNADTEEQAITCWLKGSLFGDDINDLASLLQEQMGRSDLPNLKWINIDITKSHGYLIKPYRLFSLCSHFHTKAIEQNPEASLCLIANKQQSENFDDFSAIENFQVSINQEAQIQIDDAPIEDYYYYDKNPSNYDFQQQVVKIMWRWLKAHDNKDEKRYYIGGQAMSAEDIFNEIQDETAIGIEYRNSFLELGFKHGLKSYG
jgi:hypothetical protein